MRPVGVAHDLAEIEPHVVRNFTRAPSPTFGLEVCSRQHLSRRYKLAGACLTYATMWTVIL